MRKVQAAKLPAQQAGLGGCRSPNTNRRALAALARSLPLSIVSCLLFALPFISAMSSPYARHDVDGTAASKRAKPFAAGTGVGRCRTRARGSGRLRIMVRRRDGGDGGNGVASTRLSQAVHAPAGWKGTASAGAPWTAALVGRAASTRCISLPFGSRRIGGCGCAKRVDRAVGVGPGADGEMAAQAWSARRLV